MKSRNNYNLINNLFESFAVISADNKVCYIGTELRDFLAKGEFLAEADKSFQTNTALNNKTIIDCLENYRKNNNNDFEVIVLREQEYILFSTASTGGDIVLAEKEKLADFSQIKHKLQERVKELRCLFDVTVQLESISPLKDTFVQLAKIIEDGFQHPADTVVNIHVGKEVYGNKGWEESEVYSVMTSAIVPWETKKGKIVVYLLNDEGFLDEEYSLVDEIAGKITRAIERYEKTRDLEKQKKILLSKNEALLELTEECNKRREKLRTFFRAITDRIVVVDRNFDIIMSNKDEIGESGKCYNKLFDLNTKCKNCPAEKVFETGEDEEMGRKTGRLYYSLNAYPIMNSKGEVDRVLEVCKDISDQKIMEDQLIQSDKMASLGKLVAGVAHEINNPNTFILGNLKIVQEALNDIFPILDKVYEEDNNLKIARLKYQFFKENIGILVDDMVKGANRTKKIVGDLRNFAKKDEGSLTDVINLNQVIMSNLSLTKKQIKKYADIRLDLQDNLPLLKGNVNRLEQVLVNLALNATEAIDHEKGIVEIKTAYNEETSEILLSVSDNGCGMNKEVVKSIFDPFFTTKRNRGGTGLGLSISYGIVKDHKGTIEVKSIVGKGTTFIIHFPVSEGKPNG